ncbi:alpha/beta fold hydrolase [Roseateles noduli]|uniref:alpha/beta fold hydrolase n=1 Tax=Roseateles noduli TaxID=2052484 RepID=UPI003D64F244
MKTIKNMLIATATASLAAAGGGAVAADKPTIALVHGAFCDAHAWDAVAGVLRTNGYKVININLPGRPGTEVSPKRATLDSYRQTVLTALQEETSPVVLVGHSFAGITISNVGEAAPDKVKTLVYVAAYLPKDGDSLLKLANEDKDARIGPILKPDEANGVVGVDRAASVDVFLNDGSTELRAVFPKLVIDEPLAPLGTPVHLTAARFGKLDKAYIRTSKDQVISPYLQSAMLAATPVRLTQTLDTGHLGLLTNPKGVAEAVEKAAR